LICLACDDAGGRQNRNWANTAETNLLFVSKVIYVEAIAHFYHINSFYIGYSFDHVWGSIIPSARANIRRLEVNKDGFVNNLARPKHGGKGPVWNMILHEFTKLE
jgi:hypothetical protein